MPRRDLRIKLADRWTQERLNRDEKQDASLLSQRNDQEAHIKLKAYEDTRNALLDNLSQKERASKVIVAPYIRSIVDAVNRVIEINLHIITADDVAKLDELMQKLDRVVKADSANVMQAIGKVSTHLTALKDNANFMGRLGNSDSLVTGTTFALVVMTVALVLAWSLTAASIAGIAYGACAGFKGLIVGASFATAGFGFLAGRGTYITVKDVRSFEAHSGIHGFWKNRRFAQATKDLEEGVQKLEVAAKPHGSTELSPLVVSN